MHVAGSQLTWNVPQLTVLGMKHEDETIALQAVEFWSTVCEEEIELAIEAAEVFDFFMICSS